jgi:hypothetical protein
VTSNFKTWSCVPDTHTCDCMRGQLTLCLRRQRLCSVFDRAWQGDLTVTNPADDATSAFESVVNFLNQLRSRMFHGENPLKLYDVFSVGSSNTAGPTFGPPQ